ncbi:MAG: hypothetical protein ABI629_16340 [bacterium]
MEKITLQVIVTDKAQPGKERLVVERQIDLSNPTDVGPYLNQAIGFDAMFNAMRDFLQAPATLGYSARIKPN